MEWQEPAVKPNVTGLISLRQALNQVPNSYQLDLDDLLDILTTDQVIWLLMNYTTKITYRCRKERRFGNPVHEDGGWNVCMDVDINPSDCIVYSFGIANDWSFDEDIANYGCNVYSFDPSIGLDDHKHADRIWFYNMGLYDDNIDDLVARTNHWKKNIDVLKFDIETTEHRIFHQLIKSGILRDIKLVAFELHLSSINIHKHKEDTLHVYRALKGVFELNEFKLWEWHENEVMAKKHSRHRMTYIELYWINTRFIQPRNHSL
ncbi:putative methyltransferase-like protein 24 [Saccoglossus kowalevskii]